MEDLCPRRVWGFSTGCILAPGRWTLDVASHHLSHTHVKGGKAPTDSAAPGNNNIRGDGLPLGTSSNTARFESMDETGETLYVTELFVPHVSHADVAGAAASDASGQSNWSAERLRASLLRQPSWRASPAQGRDSAASSATAAAESGCVERERAPLRAWVVEVTAPPSPSSTLAAVSPSASADIATTTTATATTAACSIAAALLPLSRVFLEVVWDGGTPTSAVSRTVDDAVHRIVAHLESLYRTPALELDGFRCFVGSAAATDAAPGGSARVSPPTAKAMTAASVVTQLREPCAPHALADMGTDALSSAWGASLYSAAGAAFVQLLQPSSASQPPPLPHQSAVDEAHGSQSCWSLCLVSVFPPARHEGAASAVQHLLQHDLQLCWEGLALSTVLAGAETVVAVAALPLNSADAEPSSIYSFPSVERAWEVHVRRFLSQQRGQERTRGLSRDDTGVDSAVGHHDTVREWELRRLSTSSRPVLEQLDAMLHKAELQQCVVDDPSLSSGVRSMRLVARDVGAPLIAPRCTSYLVRIRRGAAGGEQVRANASDDHAHGFAAVQTPAPTDATHTGIQAEERYVLQLHAPRVLSTHALVVCMAVPTSLVAKESRPGKRAAAEGGAEASAVSAEVVGDLAAAAAALSAMYRIAPYVPSLWIPREVALRGGSGICSRSGRLLLHVPACDARYGNIHVAPVASNVFTTLGSIIAWSAQSPSSRQGDAAGRDTSSPVSPTCASLANTCAVWTLIGDGRSAAAYLEDTLSEYMYDTGAKSLLNVGQPSQHERQPGLLIVRRKPTKRYSTKGTATVSGAAEGTMPSLAVQEVCSAWLDVGETHRLFLSVRDVGAGEVLLAKGSLVGPHTEFLRRDRKSRDAVTAALEAASRAEEAALEEWIGGVAAAAVAPQRR